MMILDRGLFLGHPVVLRSKACTLYKDSQHYNISWHSYLTPEMHVNKLIISKHNKIRCYQIYSKS